MKLLLDKFKEVAFAVIPIIILVIILNFTVVPVDGDMLARFLIGSITVILGLGIFLFGAEIGISPIGNLMGEGLARSNKVFVVGILGFLLGFYNSSRTGFTDTCLSGKGCFWWCIIFYLYTYSCFNWCRNNGSGRFT